MTTHRGALNILSCINKYQSAKDAWNTFTKPILVCCSKDIILWMIWSELYYRLYPHRRAAKFRWFKTWSLLAPLLPKIFFRRELFLTTSPPLPPPKKHFGQCTILGVKKFFRTYQNFSKHTNFPDIAKFTTKFTEFLTKLTQFVPFFFIKSQNCPTVELILPDLLSLPPF
jgi:hypothetical protein